MSGTRLQVSLASPSSPGVKVGSGVVLCWNAKPQSDLEQLATQMGQWTNMTVPRSWWLLLATYVIAVPARYCFGHQYPQ